MTTMRSEIDSASSWSCVTKTVVMPSFFWIDADFLAQRHAHLGVERRQRLVEQQQLRLRRQRAGERHALLLAAGELVGIAVAELRQLDDAEHLLDARVDLGLRHAGDLQAEADVLRHRQVRETAHRPGTPCRCCAGWASAASRPCRRRGCAPDVGSSKPATMRSTVVLPQPDGPRKETNSPGVDVEVEVLHHGGRPEGLLARAGW